MAAELRVQRLHPGVVGGVLVLHALLLGGLLRLGTWRDRTAPLRERAPLMLWLPGREATPPGSPPRREPAPAPPPPSARRLPERQPPRPDDSRAAPPAPSPATTPVGEAQAITPPPAGTPPATDAATTAPHGPAEARPPAPLNLALPRGASAPWRDRNPALDDPRAHTPRATLESRLAEVLGGTDHIVEERLDDGRMRLRRGNACVVVHPNRAERLDPWNASTLPKLRGAERC